MKIFLDSSVLLAASGSDSGASRALFRYAPKQGWLMTTSNYCLIETERNFSKLPPEAALVWRKELLPRLKIAGDIVTSHMPIVFRKAKDKPVLLTALAESCAFLLTLDRQDFSSLLGTHVYDLRICTPAAFLKSERDRGNLNLS